MLRDLYVRQGLGVAAVAERLGVGIHVVRENLERHRIRRPAFRRPVSRQRLEDLYLKRSLSLVDVGRELGLSRTQVTRDLRHHGIPPRAPGGRAGRGVPSRPRPMEDPGPCRAPADG